MEKSETAVSMDSDMLGDPEQTSRCKQLLDLIRVREARCLLLRGEANQAGVSAENTTTKGQRTQIIITYFFVLNSALDLWAGN